MGFLSKIFGPPKSLEEKAMDYFLEEEKKAQKYPSQYYYEVLGAYLCGSILYEESVDGKREKKIVKLPQLINREKAVELAAAALDRKNVKAMQIKFNSTREPSLSLAHIWAVITPDEKEREKWIRHCLNRGAGVHQDAVPMIADYLYYNGLVDQYCPTTAEKAHLYDKMMETNYIYAEMNKASDYGILHFIWSELLGGHSMAECQHSGHLEMKKLLESEDPEVSKAAKDYMTEQIKHNMKRMEQCSKEYYIICSYMQDNLGVKFVDENGHDVELVNGRVRKK